ncbi:MAG TPA: hypothetical protein PK205_07110 [Promineifilum sp.]|mgnify:CR=1 FL=1|nr:hypothetical protein [Promineifilum sp.]
MTVKATHLKLECDPSATVNLYWTDARSMHKVTCEYRTASYMWNVVLRHRQNITELQLHTEQNRLMARWARN